MPAARVRLETFPIYPNEAPPLAVGTVTTLPNGAPATALIRGEAPNQVLDLGLPKGNPGADQTALDAAVTQAQTAAAAAGTAGAAAGASAAQQVTTYTAPHTGAAPTAFQILVSRSMSVREYGALGDGSDQTVAINNALQAAYAERKVLEFPDLSYGVSQTSGTNRALLNPGVLMIGNGQNTRIYPLAGMPNTCDLMYVKPTTAADFLFFESFMIDPSAADGNTKLGQRAMVLDLTTVGASIANLRMQQLYLRPGNGYSCFIANNPSNVQGNPSGGRFEQCYFYDGFLGSNIGDDNVWEHCLFKTSVPTRDGVDITPINAGGGAASIQRFSSCRFAALGAWLTAHSGRHIIIDSPNAEFGNEIGSTGGGNLAGFNLQGDVLQIIQAEIYGGHISAFTAPDNSDPGAQALIYLGNIKNPKIDHVTFLKGTKDTTPLTFVTISNNASGAVIGRNSMPTKPNLTKVNDGGVGTIGVVRPVASLGSGFSNAGSGYAPAGYMKTFEGRVTLQGLLAATGAVNGVTIFTLPVDYRPSASRRFPVQALVSSAPSLQSVDVLSTGAVVYNGPSSTTSQVSLDGITFDTGTAWSET